VCFGAGYAVRERKKKFAHWSALHGGFCGARVGPFAKCGLNEALCFAVGSRSVLTANSARAFWPLVGANKSAKASLTQEWRRPQLRLCNGCVVVEAETGGGGGLAAVLWPIPGLVLIELVDPSPSVLGRPACSAMLGPRSKI